MAVEIGNPDIVGILLSHPKIDINMILILFFEFFNAISNKIYEYNSNPNINKISNKKILLHF